MSIGRGNEWTNHRHTSGATSSNCAFTVPATADAWLRQPGDFSSVGSATRTRQRLIHSTIFCPSPLRRSIKQGLIHAPTFSDAPNERRAGRMPASWRADCPAEREGWISSQRDSADAWRDTRRSYIR